MSVQKYDPEKFLHRDITERIIGVFYDVYNELGSGFFESVYQAAMMMALNDAGLSTEQKVPVPVFFRGQKLGFYEADILVESKVILELKAITALASAHEKQILHYLRATEIEVGLLLNFGTKAEIKRFAFSNERKKYRTPIISDSHALSEIDRA